MVRSLDPEDFKDVDCLSYKTDIALFDKIQDYKHPIPLQMDFFVLVVCLKGHGSININGENYEIGPNRMLICPPNIVIEKSTATLDFESRGIALSKKFVEQLSTIIYGGWDLLLFLSKNPVILLQDDEMALFMQYYELLQSKISRAECHHQDLVMESLFRAFILELLDLLERFVKVVPPSYTSAEMLFRKFLDMLSSTYPRPRSVDAYADRLCVTPKYLSAVCKKTSGRTASELINQSIVNDIRRLLQDRRMSIKEVANELDFPNLSFFGKYVKRMLGMSPKAYRASMADDAREDAAGVDSKVAG